MPQLRTLLAAIALAAAAAAGAATDLGPARPPAQPVTPPPDKANAARCAPTAVNECRAGCDKRKYDAATPKPEVAKKTQECKSACVQGC